MGLGRTWGDSFFEEIVEEKIKQDRENNEINSGHRNLQYDDEEVVIEVQ